MTSNGRPVRSPSRTACSFCGSFSAWSTCSRSIQQRGGSTKWTRGCDRAERAGCSRRASWVSSSISDATPGHGSIRRCFARARWPDRRRCASDSRRCASICYARRAPRHPARRGARHARAHASGAVTDEPGTNSISNRITAGSPTSSFSRSTGRSAGRTDTRNWSCSRTSSASSNRWRPSNLVPQVTVDILTSAYRAYRQRIHHLSLESGGSVVPSGEFADERAAVGAIWRATMEDR